MTPRAPLALLISVGSLAAAGACSDDGARTDVGPDSVSDVVPDTAPDTVPSDVAETPEAALARTIAAFCPTYASMWCERAAGACGCDAAPGFLAPAACEASFEAHCADELSEYLGAVQGGQAVLHPEAAATCFAAMEPLLDACMLLPNDLYFVACLILAPPGGLDLPGDGAACSGTCAVGLRCGSDGHCHRPGAAGAACLDLRDCSPALACNAPAEGVAGICVGPDFSDRGALCANLDGCGVDTVCLASGHKACVALTPGQACDYDHDCVAAEYCLVDSAGARSACTPLPGDGAPCANGAMCAAGLGCDMATTTCGALPGDGEACALGSLGPFLCAAGLGCSDGVCGALPGLGEACAIGTPGCATGLGCAFEREGSFCRERVGDGGACENDAACEAGFFCDFSRNQCAPARGTGAPCRDGNECGEGVCLPDETFTFRCAPTPGLGGACFIDECAGGLRCQSPYRTGACVPRVFCSLLPF